MKKIMVVALVALTTNTFAQKINNTLNFQKGQKLEIVADSKSIISQEFMGQKMDMNMNSTIIRSFDVEDVKNNTATIEHKVKRVLFDMDAMGQVQKFDSEKEEDMKGEMGKSLEKSIKNKYTMMVDAQGKVVNVKLDDDNPNASASLQADDAMSNMLSQFAEGLEVPKPGEATTFSILPEGDITKGRNWTDSIKGDETGVVKYVVSDITPNEVLIDFTSDGKIQKTQEAMGMEAIINISNKSTGKITLDRKTGLLKQKNVKVDGKGTIEVAGQSIPMTTQTNGSITVKGI